MQLRCPNKLHATMLTPCVGTLEVACASRFCGSAAGVLVLHRFDLATGEVIETDILKTPPTPVLEGITR